MSAHRVQFVAITFEDGSLGVMQFILDPRVPPGIVLPGYDHETGEREATDEAIQHEIDKSAFRSRPVSWRRIEPEHVPADRTYRNAWKDHGTHIGHDMAKAREMHRDHLRAARAPLLAQLDVEYMRAMESGHGSAALPDIAARKQALRDLPADPRIEAAKTTDDLKAIGVPNG